MADSGFVSMAMTITMVICGVLTFFFMGARFAAKAVVKSKQGIDDYVLATSWVCPFHVTIV